MQPIDQLKNTEKGKDIYILAAGPSMNLIPNSFFKDKICIGVNEVYRKYDCKYYLRKDKAGFKGCDKGKMVVAKYDCGNTDGELNDGDYYFEHEHNDCTFPKNLDLDNGKLVVSWSTITSAIHFAYFLGARNIIICGHDGEASITGNCNYDGYEDNQRSGVSREWYIDWLEKIKPQTDELVGLIREKGVDVFKLRGWE